MVKSKFIFETDRLILRQAMSWEAKGVARFFSINKEFHHVSLPKSHYTASFWEKQIARDRRDFRDDRSYRLYLFLRSYPTEVVGTILFYNIVRGIYQSCFLGYALGKDFEGEGLMSEGLRKAVEFVFGEMGLHRISVEHALNNKKSCRVLKRAGFSLVGRQPKHLRVNGRWQDHELHVLINKKWKSTTFEPTSTK